MENRLHQAHLLITTSWTRCQVNRHHPSRQPSRVILVRRTPMPARFADHCHRKRGRTRFVSSCTTLPKSKSQQFTPFHRALLCRNQAIDVDAASVQVMEAAKQRSAQDRSRHVCIVNPIHGKPKHTTWAGVVRTVLESDDSVLVRNDCCSLRRESVM